MSLAERVNQPVVSGKLCGVQRLFLVLEKDENGDAEIAALTKMLSDKESWPNRALYSILKEERKEHHPEVTVRMLENHRSGSCKCR